MEIEEGQTIQWTKEKGQTNTMTKRRRTDNTMDKRKRTKGRAMIYKTLHRKIKIQQYELHIKSR